MFGIGGAELFLILLFGFLIFGPDQLPKMGRVIGRAMRQFRNAQDEMNKVIRSEVYDPSKDDSPLKNPFEGVLGEDTSKKAANVSRTSSKTVSGSATKDVGKTETFAERKARLAREKEAARAAKDPSAEKSAAATAPAAAKPASPASKTGEEGGEKA